MVVGVGFIFSCVTLYEALWIENQSWQQNPARTQQNSTRKLLLLLAHQEGNMVVPTQVLACALPLQPRMSLMVVGRAAYSEHCGACGTQHFAPLQIRYYIFHNN